MGKRASHLLFKRKFFLIGATVFAFIIIFSFQNCSKAQFAAKLSSLGEQCFNGTINYPTCTQCPLGFDFDGANCIPTFCMPGIYSPDGCPTITNGSSVKECNADGTAYGSCVSKCNLGYMTAPNSIQPLITCQVAPCTNGAVNEPLCNACSNGQYFDGTKCATQLCTPNTSTQNGCPAIPNGFSIKTCKADGSDYDSCSSTCEPGYTASGTQPNITCNPPTCTNGATNYPTCNQCASGFYYNGTSCVAQVCSPGSSTATGCPAIPNGNSTKICNAQGSGYGSCSSTCSAGFNASGSQPNITCTIAACTNGANNPPTCNTCSAGQYFNGTNCVAQVCTPNSTTSNGCPSISNGSSIKTCNAQGSGYGTCSSSCNSGFMGSGSQPNISCCVANKGASCTISMKRRADLDWDGAGCNGYNSNCKYPNNSPYTATAVPYGNFIPDVPNACGPCLGQGICIMNHCKVSEKNAPGTISCGGSCQ